MMLAEGGTKMADEKPHLSIVICGHVDSGKSTTTGRLLFELGGIPEREVEKLKVRLSARLWILLAYTVCARGAERVRR
jgi:Elongation factor Tu GTP binding domain